MAPEGRKSPEQTRGRIYLLILPKDCPVVAILKVFLTLLSRGFAGIPFDMFSAIGFPGGGPGGREPPREITGGVRGGGNPPGMGREAPKGKRKSQGRSSGCIGTKHDDTSVLIGF